MTWKHESKHGKEVDVAEMCRGIQNLALMKVASEMILSEIKKDYLGDINVDHIALAKDRIHDLLEGASHVDSAPMQLAMAIMHVVCGKIVRRKGDE